MTIQDLGSIGEFVGAFAVVLSMLYLAVQIRQNTAELKRSAFRDVHTAYSELRRLTIESPEISRLHCAERSRIAFGTRYISTRAVPHRARMGFGSAPRGDRDATIPCRGLAPIARVLRGSSREPGWPSVVEPHTRGLQFQTGPRGRCRTHQAPQLTGPQRVSIEHELGHKYPPG